MSPDGTGPKTFEGSYMGDASRIRDETRLECKICWTIYDPAKGDPSRQIAPNTPFAALPADWRCPTCDSEKAQFMVLDAVPASEAAEAPAPAPEAPPAEAAPQAALLRLLEEGPARLQRVFTEIHRAKMRDTPLVNPALSVEPIGFRVWDGGIVGVLIAPWFMNLMLMPGPRADWSGLKVGDKRIFGFPFGPYEFVYNTRPELGPYMSCSLFSPMGEFASQLQATDTARAAIAALFEPDPEKTPAPGAKSVSRRGLLTGELQAEPGAAS